MDFLEFYGTKLRIKLNKRNFVKLKQTINTTSVPKEYELFLVSSVPEKYELSNFEKFKHITPTHHFI